MHIATLVAAWVLALYALMYGLMLLMFAGAAGVLGWPMLLLLCAAAAIYAPFRVDQVMLGNGRKSDLLVGLCILGAALFFGNGSMETFFTGYHAMFTRGFQIGEFLMAVAFFAAPAVLSLWIGALFMRAGGRALIKGRGPA